MDNWTRVNQMRMIDAALFYWERGLSVLPIQPNQKIPATGEWKKLQTTPLTDQELIAIFRRNPHYNIGVITGAVSGLVVVDWDGEESSFCLAEGLFDGPTLTVATARGLHYYLRVGRKIRSRAGLYPGVDVKGEGGYVVAPPSLHPSGVRYQFVVDEPDQWPAHRLEAADAVVEKTPSGEMKPDAAPRRPRRLSRRTRDFLDHGAPEGGRNHALFYGACNLRDCGLQQNEVEAMLVPVAERIGLKAPQIMRTIASAFSRPPRDPAHPKQKPKIQGF